MKSRINLLVQAFERRYPGCFAGIADLRRQRGKGLPDWPDYCYVPLAGAYALISSGGTITDANKAVDIGRLGALAAWKAKPMVEEFSADVYSQIIRTSPASLSIETFKKLPRWCTYLRVAEQNGGVFVHLEYDVNNGRHELRLLFDTTGSIDGLHPVPIHLGSTLKGGIEAVIAEAQKFVDLTNVTTLPNQTTADWLSDLPGIVSLALSLCREN